MGFNHNALGWDNDPQKIKRAEKFAKEIKKFIQPSNECDALDFGCGTGLLSFELKDIFHSITLIDNSKGMINVLKGKIDKENIQHFFPYHINLLESNIQLPQVDVIYNLMVLHHILNIDTILKKFYSLLKPNGLLCISDLVKEDGSFHAEHNDFEGHNGFDKIILSKKIKDNGFEPIYYNKYFTIEKVIGGNKRKYPLFVMMCRKVSNL